MLRPLGDRIVLLPAEEEEVRPVRAKKKPVVGVVLGVGPGSLRDSGERAALEIKVGDVVVYSEYGGTEVKIGDEEYIILDEGSVLAINPDAKKKKK